MAGVPVCIVLLLSSEKHPEISNRTGVTEVCILFVCCVGPNRTRPYSALHTSCRYMGRNLAPQNEAEKEEEKRGFQNNGFNQFRSDRIPLDREVPDTRDPR